MRHSKTCTSNRILSILLSVLIVLSMFPLSVAAATPPVVSTNIAEQDFTIGREVEYTVTTEANDAAGTFVIGSFVFNNPEVVTKLEYYEVKDGKWYPLTGDFGPASGFPLSNATSKFRVVFNTVGSYPVTINIKDVNTGDVICSVDEVFEVSKIDSQLSTDITEKTFIVDEYTEYSFSTIPNDDIGTLVKGKLHFDDFSAIESLQYKESKDGNWYEFNGEFGPATGFPLIEATSNFRVKFKEAGEYTFSVSINAVKDNSVLCEKRVNIDVLDRFDVKVSANEGGEVFLNETKTEELEIVENDNVTLLVKSAEKYQISSVIIDGVSQSIENVNEFETTAQIKKDTNIEVKFVRVYTINITYDKNGTVSTAPSCEGGTINYIDGTDFTLTATPNSNYRVSKVSVSSKDDLYFADNEYNSGSPYVVTLTADKDYEIEITFAPLVYKVNVEPTVNGSVIVPDEPVNIFEDAILTIIPDEGYQIDDVICNNTSIYSEIEDVADDENKFFVKLSSIEEDKNISVAFKEITDAELSDFTWNSSDAIRNEDNLYVFKNGTEIVFSTDKQGIRITFEDNSVIGDRNTAELTINEDKEIKEVALWYEHSWHVVKSESENAEFVIRYDNTKPVISLEYDDPYKNNYYKDDVKFTVTATDANAYSGIAKIEYRVEADGKQTKSDTLFTFDENGSPVNEKVVEFVVNAAENNSKSVKVFIKTTDRAGNVSEERVVDLSICTSTPIVSIDFTDAQNDEAVDAWYNKDRTAVITITDREDVFDENAATNGIVFAEGSETAFTINWSNDGDKHTANIVFTSEGHYNWSYSYENKAGLNASVNQSGGNEYAFSIDKVQPSGEIAVTSDAWKDDKSFSWESLLDKLTFGIFSNDTVYVGLKNNEGNDTLSGFQKVDYYKSTSDTVLSESELKVLFEKNSFSSEKITVNSDEQFAVYARIVDNAGNVTYLGTDGVIYDLTVSEITFDVIDKPNENSIYGVNNVSKYDVNGKKVTGIKVGVNVTENISDTAYYSGLKEIKYDIKLGDVVTQSGVLYSFNNQSPSKADLKKDWQGDIIIDAKANNGANVKLTVYVTDNAGNTTSRTVTLKEINLDTITAIVTMLGENAVTLDESKYGWYGSARTASIIITDRASCFDSVAATNSIKINATDINGNPVDSDNVVFSSWTSTNNVHTINVTFNGDAVYSWSIEYTNKAGNVLRAEEINYGDSVSPNAFTVDKSKPTGSVTVDSNIFDKFLEIVTFGLYSKDVVEVSSTYADSFSPVTTNYYKHSGNSGLSFEALDVLFSSGKFSDKLPEIAVGEQFVIYMRVTDNAGNYTYINSDGFVIDNSNTILSMDIIEEPNENKIFGIDEIGDYSDEGVENGIKIAVAAKEADTTDDSYSGIQKIYYDIKSNKNGKTVVTQSGTLYEFSYTREQGNNNNGGKLIINDFGKLTESFEGNYPTKEMLCREWTGSIVVDAELNNSCNVFVTVYVTDNANNTTSLTQELDIDITRPSIDVSFDNNDSKNSKYFDAERVATITYTERAEHFDITEAQKNIIITAKNIKGEAVENAYTITWLDGNTSNLNTDKFVAVVKFQKDANYTFNISYTDRAGNTNTAVNTGRSVAPYDFVVDTTDPTGVVTVDGYSWTKLFNVLSFGLFSNKTSVKVNVTADDITSPVTIDYYKTSSEDVLTRQQLLNTEFEPYNEFEVFADEQFTVYARITDKAGHITFINSDGFIIEDNKSGITLVKDPEVVPNDDKIYGINQIGKYEVNGEEVYGIKVDVDVTDIIEDPDVYSGIKEIKYTVTADGAVTQNGVLYYADYERSKDDDTRGGKLVITDINKESSTKNDSNVPSKKDLLTQWSGSVIVDAYANDRKSVKLTVYVKDNAGNENCANMFFDINVSVPEITVSYDDNKPLNKKYFDNQRTATIQIIDRFEHFTGDNAVISISAKDIEGKDIENAYVFSGWTSEANKTNSNKSIHTATVTFAADANYTFDMTYTSKSGNSAEKVVFTEGTVASNEFVVDTVDPEGEINIEGNIWNKLLSFITFGLFRNGKANVTISSSDNTSPCVIEYYKTNDPVAIAESVLDKTQFVPYSPFTVTEKEQFVIYAKITDFAGHIIYINSDGQIIDTDTAKISLTPAEANANGLYNGDVEIAVNVSEVADTEDLTTYPYSGISKIEYWVVSGNGENAKETQRDILYSFDYTRENGVNTNNGTLTITDKATGEAVVSQYTGNVPTKEQLKSSWDGKIIVDSALNNNCDVYVYVGVTDNAGNYSEDVKKLDIDITAPVISVTYENTNNDGALSNYFTSRKATIVITERTHHFDSKAATDGIVITAVDAKSNKVNSAYSISAWSTEKAENADLATHTAVVEFAADANYTFEVSYTDKAGNVAEKYVADKFCVDKTNPTGIITAKSAEGREESWSSIVDVLTFGFWSNTKISVSATSDDITSPVQAVEYYMTVAEVATDSTTVLNKDALEKLDPSVWQTFKTIDMNANSQFTVYLKITDNAGNYTYISTNGLIVDDQHPVEESVAPEISVTPEKPVNGIYSDDVKVSIKVDDPLVGGTYSGLKEVSYKVFDRDSKTPDVATQEGVLYKFDKITPRQDELQKTWEGEITVSAEKNNSNNVQIVIYATDNSLNTVDNSQKEAKSYAVIKIDTTAPVINIDYNNNESDSGYYYKNDRTATVVVTERNFNPDDVVIKITNTDGTIPAVVGWTKVDGTFNKDDTTYTATVSYTADGDYEFDIAYSDLAGNECTVVDFGENVTPQSFTLDKTMPVVSVTYDNHNALNGNYYKADRVATIVVNEHNFNEDRANVMIGATDDGAASDVPSISGWTTEGDVHTTTVYYGKDSRYTFDIALNDLAGNASVDYEEEYFFVDKTAPTIEITGVANLSSNNGTVIPVIKYSDTNFDVDNVNIKLTGVNRSVVALKGAYADIHNGQTFTFADFEHAKEVDDIYILSAQLVDKAGNSTSDSIRFSVNRFGSVYAIDDATGDANNKYIKESGDVIISETNADELKNIKITLFKNNETIVLEEGVDYKIDVRGGNGAWYQYTYTIFKSNFEDDGVYRFLIHSEDSAGNVAENTLDTKDFEVNFGVDKTNPVINVNNLEDGKTYALDVMNVQMSVNDNLSLTKVVVYLDGAEYQNWAGEEIETLIEEGGNFSFNISGDSTQAHELRIIAVDAAGNEIEENIEEFYVTTNIWVRYYNNKVLFFGSIAGAILVAGLLVFFVVWKRRKDEK